VLQVGADGFKHPLEAVEDLSGLRPDVQAGELARGGIDASGPADGDNRSTYAMWL